MITNSKRTLATHLLPILAISMLSSSIVFAESSRTDYDLDDDGLIEINDLADLNEMRNDLTGTSLYGENFGCPASGCGGYELTTDLDFDTNDDGNLDENDDYWNGGKGWQPIGNFSNDFSTTLEGNGHLIKNLYINDSDLIYVGLFHKTNYGSIRNIGFTGPLMSVTGYSYVGAIAGVLGGTAVNTVFSTGKVSGSTKIGGLVGHIINAEIKNVFVTGSVSGTGQDIGGVAGSAYGNVDIISSYTSVTLNTGTNKSTIGSFVGNSTVNVSKQAPQTQTVVWPNDFGATISGNSLQNMNVQQGSMSDMQCRSNASYDGCAVNYLAWSNEFTVFDYWDYGTSSQLPGLVMSATVYRDSDGDGSLDEDDVFPLDTDNDGVDNATDAFPYDFDNDGINDKDDQFPADYDNDGVNDDDDSFPTNAAAAVDADNNGKPDEWNSSCDESCQNASGLTLDDDAVPEVVSNTEPEVPSTPKVKASTTAGSLGAAFWVLAGLLTIAKRKRFLAS